LDRGALTIKSKIWVVVLIGLLITSVLVLVGCENPDPQDDPPIPVEYSESDFYGTWAESSTSGPYLYLTKSNFNWDNRFQMSISSWTKVSCNVDTVGGVYMPDWKNSIDCSYKITGIVTNNTLSNNGSSAGYNKVGQAQTLYLHLDCFGPTSDNKCIDWSSSVSKIYEWNQYFFK
jgi:hypothetical protein